MILVTQEPMVQAEPIANKLFNAFAHFSVCESFLISNNVFISIHPHGL